MDSANNVEDVDLDELPYVVWYQCRMCTNLLFDDIEKMFMHFDKKHGAMIDCDELRGIVYKNGLCMGGLSRSPKPKPVLNSEDGNETETELASPPYPQSFGDDDDDEERMDKIKMQTHQPEIGTHDMVLPKVQHDGGYDDDEEEDFVNNPQIQNINEGYEESVYESTSNDIDMKYNHKVYDDDEQLEEEYDDLPANENGENHYDLSEELVNDKCNDAEVSQILEASRSRLCQDTNNFNGYDEPDQNDEGEYHHDGNYHEEDELGEEDELSISAEQSINDDDLDDFIYGEDESYEVGDEDIGNEMYANEGNQSGEILNYGYSCKFCGKFFTTRRGVESHEQHHKTQSAPIIKRTNEPRHFPCKICKDKSFPSFKDLKMHVKTHTPERVHICKFCFSTFNNTASLTKHLTIHTRENPHKCHCGKTFVSANTLKIHKKIHTGIKPFVCNFFQCGRAFVTKSTLESHLRTHTGEKPYQCSYCPSSFTTSSAKYRHERHVHKVPEPSLMQADKN